MLGLSPSMAHHLSNPHACCFPQRRAVERGYLGNRETLLYHLSDPSLWTSVALSESEENDTLHMRTPKANELPMTESLIPPPCQKSFPLNTKGNLSFGTERAPNM